MKAGLLSTFDEQFVVGVWWCLWSCADDISATPFSQEFGMNPSAEEAASDDEDDVARGATSPGLGRSLLLLDHLEEDAAFEAPLTISKSSRKLRLVNNSGWGLVTKTMAPNVARERTLGVWR